MVGGPLATRARDPRRDEGRTQRWRGSISRLRSTDVRAGMVASRIASQLTGQITGRLASRIPGAIDSAEAGPGEVVGQLVGDQGVLVQLLGAVRRPAHHVRRYRSGEQ